MAVTPSDLKLQTSRDNRRKANDQENTIGQGRIRNCPGALPEGLVLKAEIVTLGFANGKTSQTHP